MSRLLIFIIPISILAISVTIGSSQKLDQLENLRASSRYAETEMLYLPNGEALEAISLGYKNVLADLLWFNTINYFGKHYRSDKDYRWLEHSCDLVTQIDTRADYAYEFCGMMLAWEAQRGEEAVRLLERAVKQFPNDWRFHYYLGITVALFLGDDQRAQDNFKTGARLPGAPAFLGRLAAKKMATAGDLDQAVSFVSELIQNTADPTQRTAYIDRLHELQHEQNIRALETAVQMYKENFHRAPTKIEDLVSAGIVANLGKDPFGGEYTLDPQNAQIDSTTHKTRISREVVSPFAKKLRQEKLQK